MENNNRPFAFRLQLLFLSIATEKTLGPWYNFNMLRNTSEMKRLEEIKNIMRAHRSELSENYSVKNIGIFGSYRRGEQREASDLDVLVEFEKPVSLLALVSLENHLADITGLNVDVVPKEDIRPELREEILATVDNI